MADNTWFSSTQSDLLSGISGTATLRRGQKSISFFEALAELDSRSKANLNLAEEEETSAAEETGGSAEKETTPTVV